MEDDVVHLQDVFLKFSRKLTSEWSKYVEGRISGSQALILEKLACSGPAKSSDLAEELGITMAGVTSLSDKLVLSGYAKRTRTDEDRRVVYLEITASGLEMLQVVRKQRLEIFNKLFKGLSPDDLNHLIRIYEQVLQNIDRSAESR
ncbi:MAG: transcriptional regulator [Bacilli bacterium]|nr:transcriptional regulator [Bacilli bacterium]